MLTSPVPAPNSMTRFPFSSSFPSSRYTHMTTACRQNNQFIKGFYCSCLVFWRLTNNTMVHYRHRLVWGVIQEVLPLLLTLHLIHDLPKSPFFLRNSNNICLNILLMILWIVHIHLSFLSYFWNVSLCLQYLVYLGMCSTSSINLFTNMIKLLV